MVIRRSDLRIKNKAHQNSWQAYGAKAPMRPWSHVHERRLV